ncbi:helix-turn-helix transcriptional regulator [Enterococcus italicus]|uniref:helix-turn-helix transcriptional regulator n=1 Tax=Enterococcus italicus TaxID=246144 RepID=UPI00207459F5|nr:helix-turn-helix domain-containing protein [Enterococcus italicus]
MENLISLKEYAELYGVTPDTVRQKVLRGGFKSAQKIGRNWVINADEPYDDKRAKGGNIKVKNIKKAVEESMNSTYGYFIYNSKTNEVTFQSILSPENFPETDDWEPYEHYLCRKGKFLNQEEQEDDLKFALESFKNGD